MKFRFIVYSVNITSNIKLNYLIIISPKIRLLCNTPNALARLRNSGPIFRRRNRNRAFPAGIFDCQYLNADMASRLFYDRPLRRRNAQIYVHTSGVYILLLLRSLLPTLSRSLELTSSCFFLSTLCWNSRSIWKKSPHHGQLKFRFLGTCLINTKIFCRSLMFQVVLTLWIPCDYLTFEGLLKKIIRNRKKLRWYRNVCSIILQSDSLSEILTRFLSHKTHLDEEYQRDQVKKRM